MKKTKIISLLIVAVMLVAVVLSIGLSSFAAEEATQAENKGTIDVWLIGGQSNAVGYGDDAPTEAYDDARYFTGFDNTLFYGVHEQFQHNKDELQFVSLGHGQYPGRSGAEIGIAKAVDGTGKMNAVIKCAVGATSLYPYFKDNISNQVGTWTSPSYEARANMSKSDANYATLGTYVTLDGTTDDIPDIDLNDKITNGNAANNGNVKSGNMYRMFIKTVTDGVAKLRAEGYTPVIRGMWWMQGEAETYAKDKAALYDELLTCLINDIRKDVAAIVGDASLNSANDPMPFLAGNIIWRLSNLKEEPKYLYEVNDAQAAVAKDMKNVGYLDRDETIAQSFFGQQDNWHYNVATQQYFGEQLVKFVLEKKNQKLVAANGFGFTLTGGGTIATGSSVTVKFTANSNYKINSVKLNGNAITLNNGSYTFTVNSDAVFDVSTSYTGTLPSTAYGTITDKYVSAEDYPFALFKNGVFQQGYAAWITVMNSLPAGASSDEYVILLRRNYETKDFMDDSGALAINSIDSKLTLDLGGYQMTRSHNAYLFDTYHSNGNKFATNVTVKNGTIISDSNATLIGLNYSTASANANARAYNFTFENVTIKNTASSRTVPLITACWEDGNSNVSAGIHANITLNGCTVDFGNITNGIAVGLTNDAKATNTVGTLTINGGNIISKSGNYLLAKTDGKDTVTVGKYNGNYPTVTLPTGVSPSTVIYKDAEGNNCGTVASKGVASGSNTVYTMAPDALVTPYGTITDSNFANTSTYPFAIFNKDGFKTCATSWKNAVNAAIDNLDSNKQAFIYMRRDYETNGRSNDSFNQQFTYLNGTVEIDLGGYTLARNGANVFDIWVGSADYAAFDSTVNIKNGKIVSKDGNPIMGINRNDVNTVANKKIYFNYTNVTFKTEAASSYGIIFTTWNSNRTNNKYNVEMQFNYYDCTFDAKNIKENHHLFYGEEPNNQIDVDVRVYGGQFINMEMPWMIRGTSGDKMSIGKYDGKYPTLTTAAGVEVKDINSNFGILGTGNSNDVAKIVKVSSDSTYNYYTFALQQSTPYGYISAAYGDASAYPIAFFSYNGTSYTFLKAGTFGTIREFYSKTEDKNIVAYLRANHTIDKNVDLAQFRGTLTVDLNGKTLTSGDGHMFDVYNIGSNGVAGFASNAIIKNGTLASTSGFAFGINSGGITGQNKIMNVTYEGVTFKYVSGNKTNDGTFFNAWKCDGADEFGTVLTFNFNNCTFDYTNAPSNAFMFNFTGIDSTNDTKVTAYFNGGKIIAPSISGWQLFKATTTQDNVYFGDTAPQVQIASGGSQPTVNNSVTTSDKTYSYILVEAGSDYKLYSLEVFTTYSEETPYATITGLTSETASVVSYPLAVFAPSGTSWTSKGVYSTWFDAVNAALATDGSVVYFRGNLNLSGSTPSLNGKQITFTVDMNGKTLTKVTDGYLFSNYLGAAKTAINITFKNGSLVHGPKSSWQPFFNLDYGTGHTVQAATFNYKFENVSFINNRTTYEKYFIFCAFEGAYSAAIKDVNATIVYDNCTFNAGGAYIFDCTQDGNKRDKIDVTVTVNGGKIVSNDHVTADKLVRINASGDSVKFGAYNGSYTEFVYPNAIGNPSTNIIVTGTDGQERILWYDSTNGSDNVYKLFNVVSTTYGKMPTNSNLVALFNTDKTYIGGYSTVTDATKKAMENPAGNYVILLRNNVSQTNGTFITNLTGSITIDLGGYTLTKSGTSYIAECYYSGGKFDGGKLTVKNGYLVNKEWSAFFCFNYGSSLSGAVDFDFEFDSVSFKSDYAAASGKNVIFETWDDGGNTASAITANVVFNNCTFDYTGSAVGEIMLGLTNGATKAIFNVTVKGGTIKADTNSFVFAKTDSGDSVKFGKNSSGKYTALTLDKGTSAPSSNTVYTTVDGVECVFVKASSDGTNDNYTLYPKAMIGYKIQTSVTLWSNFVYNIYIPEANFNKAKVNDKDVNATLTEIDGKNYWHVEVNLPASASLGDIKLTVTINAGKNATVDASWTLNVLKYTKSVLNGTYDTETKNLMKDMLVYASSAHSYFGNALSSAAASEITTLVGSYTRAVPTGTAKKPAGKTYFTDVAIYLGEVPSFRFYLASGYTKDNFTFTVGGRSVEATLGNDNDGKGNYLEITMYAYMMLDDVSYTVKGTNVTETYNIFAYYDYAKNTLKDAKVTAIVEGLMKYSVGAKAYKNK